MHTSLLTGQLRVLAGKLNIRRQDGRGTSPNDQHDNVSAASLNAFCIKPCAYVLGNYKNVAGFHSTVHLLRGLHKEKLCSRPELSTAEQKNLSCAALVWI